MVNLSRISTPNCFLIIQTLVRKLEHTNFRRLPLRSPCGEASAPALLCSSTTLACSSTTLVWASSTRHSLLSPSSCSPPHTTAQPPNNPKTGCKDPSIFQTVQENCVVFRPLDVEYLSRGQIFALNDKLTTGNSLYRTGGGQPWSRIVTMGEIVAGRRGEERRGNHPEGRAEAPPLSQEIV